MDELHHSTRQLNQNIDRLEARLQQLQAQLLSQSVQKQD